MKRLIISFLIMLMAVSFCYSEGSLLSTRIGAGFPLLGYYPFSEPQPSYAENFGLSTGLFASLSYGTFLNSKTSIGVEVGYSYYQGENGNSYSVIPCSAKISYFPVLREKFDLSLSASTGISVTSKLHEPRICPFISFSINPTYRFRENLGLGINAEISGIINYYSRANNAYHPKSYFALIAPVTFNVTYRY